MVRIGFEILLGMSAGYFFVLLALKAIDRMARAGWIKT